MIWARHARVTSLCCIACGIISSIDDDLWASNIMYTSFVLEPIAKLSSTPCSFAKKDRFTHWSNLRYKAKHFYRSITLCLHLRIVRIRLLESPQTVLHFNNNRSYILETATPFPSDSSMYTRLPSRPWTHSEPKSFVLPKHHLILGIG